MGHQIPTINYRISIILVAYLLDLIFGDPQWNWHPVRIIGRLIIKLEAVLNKVRFNKWLSGLLLVILVTGITVICVFLILKISRLIHPSLYFVVSVLLIYFALAVRSLAVEAGKVYKALSRSDIIQARKNLSMIVARDTQVLDQPQVIRATVETVAESTMDGIISPLFYVFLGGPVLLWAYKAINTLDSMVGYRNDKYIIFGRASAKIDAVLNFIPAKITCLYLLIAGYCCGKYHKSSLSWLVRYIFKGKAYNGEATEAVMASALGVRLGGINFYNSTQVQKNFIGDNVHPLKIMHIKDSIKIAYISSGLSVATGIFFVWLTGRR